MVNNNTLKMKNLVSYEIDSKTKNPFFENISFDIKKGQISAFFDERKSEKQTLIGNILSGKKNKSSFSLFTDEYSYQRNNKMSQSMLALSIEVFDQNVFETIKQKFDAKQLTLFEIFQKNLSENENIKKLSKELNNIYPKYYKIFSLKNQELIFKEELLFLENSFELSKEFVNANEKLSQDFETIDYKNILNHEKFADLYFKIVKDFLDLYVKKLKGISELKNNVFNTVYDDVMLYKNKEKKMISQKIQKENDFHEAKELSKENKEVFLAKKNIKLINEEIEMKKVKIEKHRANISGMISDFINYFRQNYKIYKRVYKLHKKNSETRLHFFKLATLNQLINNKLKKNLSILEFSWLETKDALALFKDIKEYNEQFWDQMSTSFSLKMSFENIKRQMYYDFDFDFKSYKIVASSNKKDFKKEIFQLNKNLTKNHLLIKSKKNSLPEFDENKLYEATQIYNSFMAEEKWKGEVEPKKLILRNKNLLRKINFLKKNLLTEARKEKEVLKNIETFHNEFVKKIEFRLSRRLEEKFSRLISLSNDAQISLDHLTEDFNEIKDLFDSKDFIFKKHLSLNVITKKFITDSLKEVNIPYYFSYFKNPHLWRTKNFNLENVVIAFLISGKTDFIYINNEFFSKNFLENKNFSEHFKKILKRKNIGVLLKTYTLRDIDFFADEFCIIYHGKIIEKGKTAEILNNPVHKYSKKLFENTNTSEEPLKINYIIDTNPVDVLKMYKINENHEVLSTINQYKDWTTEFPNSVTPTISFFNTANLNNKDYEKYKTKFESTETKIIDITKIKKTENFLKENTNIFLKKTSELKAKQNLDFLTKTSITKNFEKRDNE